MRDLIPWSKINPGGSDPTNDKLHPDVRADWNEVRPTLNFFIFLTALAVFAMALIMLIFYLKGN